MKKLLLPCLVLTLISCNDLKEGYVTRKWYEEGHRYIRSRPIIPGKPMVLTESVWDDEDYMIEIESRNDGERIRTSEIEVTKEVFDSIQVGVFYSTVK